MARGWPRAGVQLVDQERAPAAVRRRLRVVLGTLVGDVSIAQACAQLGIGRSRLYALRQDVLRGALAAVQARPRGRPRVTSPDDTTVRALRRRIRELELALRATQLRSEIALTMPFLLDRAGRKKKGGRASTPRAARTRRARSKPRRPS